MMADQPRVMLTTIHPTSGYGGEARPHDVWPGVVVGTVISKPEITEPTYRLVTAR